MASLVEDGAASDSRTGPPGGQGEENEVEILEADFYKKASSSASSSAGNKSRWQRRRFRLSSDVMTYWDHAGRSGSSCAHSTTEQRLKQEKVFYLHKITLVRERVSTTHHGSTTTISSTSA
ncbi:unnamed protein product, partial [Amoebophrya sp. A120]|eukprot:GSA120T00001605001.1